MPLGNLTSQFFANIYLNELDYFVKHELKAKYYIRYVDDFVILDNRKENLEEHRERIDEFLKILKLQLHPDKSKIINLKKGISFLGFRIFEYHKLLKKSNMRKARKALDLMKFDFENNEKSYDVIFAVFEDGLLMQCKQRLTD